MSRPRAAKVIGVLSAGSGAALVLQLLVGVFLARVWSREAFGSFLQVTMVVGTVSPILFLGVPSSLYYFLPRYTDHRRARILAQSLALLVALGAAGALGVALGAPSLASALNNAELAPAIRRYGLALAGMLPAAAAHPLLVSLGRYRAATLFVFGLALADAAVTITMVLAGAPLSSMVLGLAALHLAAGAGVTIGVARLVVRAGPAAWWPLDRALLAEQLRYAVPFAASLHVGTASRFLDRYIIGAAFVPGLFAVYAVGAKEVPVVPLVLSSITIVLQQRFTELHREGRTAEILPSWQAAMRKQSLLVLPLAALLCLLADPFVTGLYSERYRDSVPIFRIYLGLLALRVAAWPMVLVATGETRALVRGSALSLLASVAVGLALVRPLGLVGPAIGAVAGPVAAAIYYLHRTGRVLDTPWRRIVPWCVIGRVGGSALAAALLLLPLARYAEGPLEAGALALAYGLLFFVVARLTGALRGEDLAWLTHRVEREGASSHTLLGDRSPASCAGRETTGEG